MSKFAELNSVLSFVSDSTITPGPAEAARARFTLDGDRALERHLDRVCDRVRSGVRGIIPETKLQAILLGGGYGRGEGGVLRDSAGDWPYNDMEFYVIVEGNRHLNETLYRRPLEVLGEILTHLADVEVEFKIASLAELRTQPVSMFSYDLFSGNRQLWGDVNLLSGCEHHRRAEDIPLSEATRLLMNRSTGLLLARQKLAADPLAPGDADFIRRNIAKAALACGDAVLTARKLYHWSCRERHTRLERLIRTDDLPGHELLLEQHAMGVEFKLHPEATLLSRSELLAMHAEIAELARRCWLWVEQQRLGRVFASVREYALTPVDVCPGEAGVRSVLMNLRADGFRPQLSPPPWRHPRQRLFRALAVLLWDPTALNDPAMVALLQRELRTHGTNGPELMRAYVRLWERVR